MQVNDLVVYFDAQYRYNRVWQVKSVCLGAVGQESLIELESLTEKPGRDTSQTQHHTTWVPEPLLRLMPVFSQTQVPVPTTHRTANSAAIGAYA